MQFQILVNVHDQSLLFDSTVQRAAAIVNMNPGYVGGRRSRVGIEPPDGLKTVSETALRPLGRRFCTAWRCSYCIDLHIYVQWARKQEERKTKRRKGSRH